MTPFKKNLIYTKAINTLLLGLSNDLLDVILASSSNNLSIYEFMFFISFINKNLNGHCYSKSELINLMFEFRGMSKFQKNKVIDIVDNYCNPKNFKGNKKNKRDFHN
jgi:type IIS restriction enzyme R protein (MBOIIR)